MRLFKFIAAFFVVVVALATLTIYAPTTKAAAVEATPWYKPLASVPSETNQLSAMAGGNPISEYYTSDRTVSLYSLNQLVNVGAECLNGGQPLILTMTKSPARRVETVGYDAVLLPEYIARADIGKNMVGVGPDGTRYTVNVDDSFLAQYAPNNFVFTATINVVSPRGSFRQTATWSQFVDPTTGDVNINAPKLGPPACNLAPDKLPAADKGD